MEKVRKWGTINEVIDAYFRGRKGPWYAGNVFFTGSVLYSYGNHFPMVVRTPEGEYVINADKYSRTTSSHQNRCFSRVQYMVSFEILRRILEHEKHPTNERFMGFISAENIAKAIYTGEIAFRDSTEETWEETGKYWFRRWKGPKSWNYGRARLVSLQEMAKIKQKEARQEYTSTFHKQRERRPQAVVFQFNGKDYLASMDGHQYFTSELPEHCPTVNDALECLRPLEVRGMEPQRQGEWFFVEVPGVTTKEVKKTYKCLEKKFVLPKTDPDSNDHTATRGGYLMDVAFMKTVLPINWTGAVIVISGNVRHSEHGQLTLSTLKDGPKLFAAFHNREVLSWSASSVGVQID